MKRFTSLILIAALVALCFGAYHCFLGLTTFPNPTEISLIQLEKHVPFNRHLKIVGAVPLLKDGVVFYQTRRGSKVENSECTFIPLTEKSLNGFSSLTPRVLLRVSQPLLDIFIKSSTSMDQPIQGIRLTSLDLPQEAKKLVSKSWGETSTNNMLVIDYMREARDLENGFKHFILGAFLIWLLFYISKKT